MGLDPVVVTDWRAKRSTLASQARTRRAVLVQWGSSTNQLFSSAPAFVPQVPVVIWKQAGFQVLV